MIDCARRMRTTLLLLSLGLFVTPAGNSDTHTINSDPMGMPRTFVRVPDDSILSVDAVVATQTGANNMPRDVVVTNGPMIDVRFGGVPALGTVVPAVNQPIALVVTIRSADWAPFDTLAVPGGSWCQHVNESDRDPAILFLASDEPVLKALALYQKHGRTAAGEIVRLV